MNRQLFLILMFILFLIPARAWADNPPAWKATDTRNAAVAVPSDKTSVLVFLRPGQQQSDEQIKLLTASLKDRKNIQVIAIVSGDDAARSAARLAANWNWPIIADTEYAASGNFTVRVWPSTLVVSAAGEKLAHIAGLPASLDNDLSAYLDYAAKKIDKAALDKRLADRQVVADSPDEKAIRHVEVAQRLAARGLADDARRELAAALALGPKNQNVLLHVARTQLAIGDAADADKLLNTLAADASASAPPTVVKVLKGWCALEQNRWDDARNMLLDAARLNPDPAENYYLLGRVYDHDNNPAKAAECYRKAFEHTPLGKSMTHR